ncbi:hypothetical protein LAW23_20065, partial [Escherichia coli]
GKNSLNRLIRCVCGKKIGPDPRNFNQRVSLGRNDLLIRTFLSDRIFFARLLARKTACSVENPAPLSHTIFRPFLPSIGDGSVCDSQEKS